MFIVPTIINKNIKVSPRIFDGLMKKCGITLITDEKFVHNVRMLGLKSLYAEFY